MEIDMNLAKVSVNGQLTIPIEVRKKLRINTGDKVLFFDKPNGEVVISNANASIEALEEAQRAFAGAAEKIGWNGDADVTDEIMRMRYGEESK
jgi:AbrB family looped-hinge helix DNA binding protein